MAPSAEDSAEQLAREVVLKVAPEEAEIFDLVSAAYRRDPQRLATAAGRDEMLGFGVEAVVALLTPVVLGAISEVISYLATETADAVGVPSRLQRLLRRGRHAAPAPVVELDPAQVAGVREIVLAKCRQAGVEPERAGLVADAVAGALSAGD